MIRKRPEADNTMKGPVLKNQYWSDMSRYPCPDCGELHDSSGRTLDDRGKIVPNSIVKCALVEGIPNIAPHAPIGTQASRTVKKKPNRMLDTEAERLQTLTHGLGPIKR